jgi:hypothetical protein
MRLSFLSANNLSVQEINISRGNRNSHKMLYTTDNITAYLWSKLIGSVTTSDARIDSKNNTKGVIILEASMRVIISLILCLV